MYPAGYTAPIGFDLLSSTLDADVGSNSKAFAAFSATSINDSTTTRGTHALTKAVFISSLAIARLESAFQRGRPRNYIISLLAGFLYQKPHQATMLYRSIQNHTRSGCRSSLSN